MLLGLKKLFAILAVFFIIAKIAILSAIALQPKITGRNELDVSAKEILDLTNRHREQNGLNTLSVNPRLTQAAVNKAESILTEQYFSHTSPDGRKFSAWIKEVGYDYFYVGENLAIDFQSGQEAFDAWIKSAGHKANIEKPQYQEIGIAVLNGKFKNHPTAVIVQLFGTRVLGGQESQMETTPLDLTVNYFYARSFWAKSFTPTSLAKLNLINNYLLILSVGLCLIIYTPLNRSQINTKQPIISRYQAKIFKE